MASSSRAEVSKWIFIIILYIAITTLIFSLIQATATYYNLNQNVTYNSPILPDLTNKVNFCSNVNNPSYPYLSENFASQTNNNAPCSSLRLELISPTGQLEDACNSFNDCNWINETSLINWWIFNFNSSAKCNGSVNFTSYGITYNIFDHTKLSEMSGIHYNKSNCLKFGYVWTPYQDVSGGVGFWSTYRETDRVFNFVNVLTGFNFTFGIPEPYETFFIFLFVTLPRIILIFAIAILFIG